MKHHSLSQQRILFVLALTILVLLYFRFYYSPTVPSEEIYHEIVVEVAGEVVNPGFHIFREPPSLGMLLRKAGTFNEASLRETDSTSELLDTGTLITVKSEPRNRIRVKLARMEARKLLVFSIPLDLNGVSVGDLRLVPGLGDALAQEIIRFREKRKGFRSVGQLREVRGIGDKKWQSLRRYFTVR